MTFQVEQDGFFRPGLIWEYGRVLAKSRLKTLWGKLLFFPGAWVFFMGLTFTVGIFTVFREPLPDNQEMGMLLMVPITVLLLIWGLSWCGIHRLLTALGHLLRMKHTEARTCFYSSRVEDVQDQLRSEYPYDVIRDVYEGKRAFFLQLNSRQFLILQKSCFTRGDPGAFRRLMDEKIGRPVRKL